MLHPINNVYIKTKKQLKHQYNYVPYNPTGTYTYHNIINTFIIRFVDENFSLLYKLYQIINPLVSQNKILFDAFDVLPYLKAEFTPANSYDVGEAFNYNVDINLSDAKKYNPYNNITKYMQIFWMPISIYYYSGSNRFLHNQKVSIHRKWQYQINIIETEKTFNNKNEFDTELKNNNLLMYDAFFRFEKI